MMKISRIYQMITFSTITDALLQSIEIRNVELLERTKNQPMNYRFKKELHLKIITCIRRSTRQCLSVRSRSFY